MFFFFVFILKFPTLPFLPSFYFLDLEFAKILFQHFISTADTKKQDFTNQIVPKIDFVHTKNQEEFFQVFDEICKIQFQNVKENDLQDFLDYIKKTKNSKIKIMEFFFNLINNFLFFLFQKTKNLIFRIPFFFQILFYSMLFLKFLRLKIFWKENQFFFCFILLA
jgi:hypothetical protein